MRADDSGHSAALTEPKAKLMNRNNKKKKKILSLFTSLNSPQLRHIIKRQKGGGGGEMELFLPQKDNH